MKCNFKNDDRMIAQYITGDLTEKDRTIVEEHIFECRDCFEKAQIFEKAAFLIQVEGPAAFVPQRSLSLSEKIKEFFTGLFTVRPVIVGYAAIGVVVCLAVFSVWRYSSETKSSFALHLPNSIIDELRSVDQNLSEEDQLKYLLGNAITELRRNEFEAALTYFTAMRSSIDKMGNSAKQDSLFQQSKIHFFVGITQVVVWQQRQSGYLNWVGIKTGAKSRDTGLLIDAKKNLNLAQEHYKESLTSAEEVTLNSFLARIEEELTAH